MKSYPSITKEIIFGMDYYVFDKLDGSNMRAEWNRKNGFYKFGSRNRLVDANDELLGKAPDLFRNKYEDDLSRIFREQRYEKAVAFFEFWGPNSFAGNHVLAEDQDVTLFDVHVHKKSLIPPKDFLKIYGHLDIPALLHHGKVNKEFVELVRRGELEGITEEGVVCKCKNPKKTLLPLMFKIKTLFWIDKLKNFCGEDAEKFKRLL